MLKYFKNLIKRKGKQNPVMSLGAILRPNKDIQANKVYTSIKCTVRKDTMLLYRGEKNGRIFFFVRCNNDEFNTELVRDKDLIYIYKPTFDSMDYTICKF